MMQDNFESNSDLTKVRTGGGGLARELWLTFSSMKTAIVLLLVLAIVSVIGTLIPQGGPPDMYYQKYGQVKGWIITKFCLNNLYDSPAYKILLILIGVNLLVCSINRFGTAWKRTFQPVVDISANQIKSMQKSEEICLQEQIDSLVNRAVTALRTLSYQVLESRSGSDVAIYASKGRLGIWGPYVTHLSILVIFVGAIVGSLLGFSGYTRIAENSLTDSIVFRKGGKEEVRELPFSVRLNSFTIPRGKNGHPLGYKSDISIIENGKVARRKTIDVNHPLSYKGISFFQSSYGPVLVVKVKDSKGNVASASYFVDMVETSSGVRLYVDSDNEFNLKKVELGGRSVALVVRYVTLANLVEDSNLSSVPGGLAASVVANDQPLTLEGMHSWQELGLVKPLKPVKYKDLTVEVETLDYTGLQVTRDPGLPIVYLGFALMLGGIFLSFYVPFKVIRMRFSEAEDGKVAVVMGAFSKSVHSAYAEDFERLKNKLINGQKGVVS
jgi:cytochrome c biogenesis protein